MKLLGQLLCFFILGYGLMGCQNAKENGNGGGDLDKIDKAFYGGCYHNAAAEFEEFQNITVDNGKLSGTGIRQDYKMNDRYDLIITGEQKSDGGFDVAITATSTRTKSTESTYETWLIGKKKLQIKNRSNANFIGDFTLYKINCEGSVEKDSTLFDGVFGFFEGHAVVLKDGRYGLVNENWELTIPPSYRSLGVVNEGTIVYYNDTLNRHGVIDTKGNIIIKPIFDQVTGFSEGLCGVLDRGKWGFVDKKGKVVILPQYFMINYFQPMPTVTTFNEGLANVAIADTEWGYINPKGETVLPFQYKFANPFINGKAKVMRKGENNWIYIDKNGSCVEGCN